jgi:phosphatidylglycerophosphate synthase
MAESLFDITVSCVLVAVALGMIVLRRLHRGAVVIDGLQALATAAAGIMVAATSSSPLEIGCAAAIAFCAVTQQYAALVHAHIARRIEDGLAGAPLGFAAMCGLAAYLAAGRPIVLVIALACWSTIECTYAAVMRGIAITKTDARTPRPPILPPLAGRARWQRLGEGLANARDSAFWGLVVARPLARVLLQLVAECRFLTPNRITVASIAVCTAAAFAIVEDHIAIAIVLVGIRSVLDSLDGQLARYRACGTNLGSYVDKVSDLYCWAALFAALGVRAYAAHSTTSMLLLPCLSAIALALLGFSLWFVRALSTTPVAPGAPSQLGARAWLASWWRIVLFEEPDFYLWIALALATARFDNFIPFIAGAYVVRALALVIVRAHLVRDVFRTTGKELQA